MLYLKGAISLWKSRLSLALYLTSSQIAAQFEMKLARLFWVSVDLKGSLSSKNFVLHAKMKSDFAQVVRKKVNQGAASFVALFSVTTLPFSLLALLCC